MLENLEKAKAWAENRAHVYCQNVLKKHFCVCKWNNGYIVHDLELIKEHYKEYSSNEIVYCTNQEDFKKLMVLLRFQE